MTGDHVGSLLIGLNIDWDDEDWDLIWAQKVFGLSCSSRDFLPAH